MQPQRQTTFRDDRSIGALIRDLMHELSSLVKNETELAKAEVSEKVSQVGAGVASLAVAAALLIVGLVVLMEAAVYGVAQILPQQIAPWLAPLIVGGIVAIIGLALLMKGRSNLQPKNLTPDRTVESMHKDRAVAQEHLK